MQDNDNLQATYKQSEADLAAAKAAVENARINLAYAHITSPITGRIGKSAVTEGALVVANQADALSLVQQLDTVYVDVTQSSTDLLKLQRDFAEGRLQRNGAQQASVELWLEDGSRYAHAGTLKFSEVTVDPGTGSVLLRAQFPNPERLLLPGMFVRARLVQASSAAALLVPQAAVSRNARGEAVVMVVGEGEKAVERVIQVDRSTGSQWLVTSGLAAGERVISLNAPLMFGRRSLGPPV